VFQDRANVTGVKTFAPKIVLLVAMFVADSVLLVPRRQSMGRYDLGPDRRGPGSRRGTSPSPLPGRQETAGLSP
jgi:hypothetical protein